MKETISVLQEYGAWAIVFFLSYAIINLYADFKKTIKEKDALIETMYSEHHKEIVSVVRECTAILTMVGEALDRCEHRTQANIAKG